MPPRLSSTPAEVSRPARAGQPRPAVTSLTGVRGSAVAVAITGSAILHGGLLAVLRTIDAPARPAIPVPYLPRVPLPRSAPPTPDPIPIELVVLPAPVAPVAPSAPLAPGAAAPAPSSTASAPAAAAIDRGAATTVPRPAEVAPVPAPGDGLPRLAFVDALRPGAATTAEPGAGPGEPGEPGYLSMRGAPRDVRPTIDPRRAHLTVAPADPDWRPPALPHVARRDLRPDGGGTFRTDQPGFVGRVARDGRVSFADKPSAHIQLNLPNPGKIARGAARGLERWYDDPAAAVRAADADPQELPGSRATELDEPSAEDPEEIILPIVTGGFDATDAIMRANGMDPYASAKLAWMDRTRDERLRLGRVHRARLLAESATSMRRNLARLWARPGLDLAGRKAALFELWDDCVESGDSLAVEACGRTRAAVIAFVRSRLPAGSPSAYTAAELDALNRGRASTDRFAPYD